MSKKPTGRKTILMIFFIIILVIILIIELLHLRKLNNRLDELKKDKTTESLIDNKNVSRC